MSTEKGVGFWIGHFIGRHPGKAALCMLGMLAAASAGLSYSRYVADRDVEALKQQSMAAAVIQREAEARRVVELKRRCTEDLKSVIDQAKSALAAGSPNAAAGYIDACDPYVDAGGAKALATVSAAIKARAGRIAAAWQAERAAVEKADLAKRRKEGVSVGMSREEVLQSSWGKPRSINRTTRASGTDEQWVYGGGYLYFTDGVLRAIQH